MSDIFTKAFQSLADTLARCAAVPVTYTRRDGTTRSLNAVRGRSSVKITSADGTVLEYSAHDFIFRSTDLDFTPQRGDTVTDSTKVYEVAALAGTSHWRASSPQIIRIHCKRA